MPEISLFHHCLQHHDFSQHIGKQSFVHRCISGGFATFLQVMFTLDVDKFITMKLEKEAVSLGGG